MLADGESLPAIALVTQAAGTLAAVFAARADLSGEHSAERLVQRYFTIPTRVIRGTTTMEVRLPLEHIDLDVRRAGLDADPGWIPWLERRVDLIFDAPPGTPGH